MFRPLFPKYLLQTLYRKAKHKPDTAIQALKAAIKSDEIKAFLLAGEEILHKGKYMV